MKKLFVVPLLLLAAVGHEPLAAQAAPDDALAEVASALHRIAVVLEKQLEGNRLDLLIKRLETGHRRLDQVEGRLRSARDEHESAKQKLSRLETQLSQVEDYLRYEATEEERVLRSRADELRLEVELARPRVEELERRVGALEGERTRREREVEDWQAFVDRELSAGP